MDYHKLMLNKLHSMRECYDETAPESKEIDKAISLIAAAPLMRDCLNRIEASIAIGSIKEDGIRKVALKDIAKVLGMANGGGANG